MLAWTILVSEHFTSADDDTILVADENKEPMIGEVIEEVSAMPFGEFVAVKPSARSHPLGSLESNALHDVVGWSVAKNSWKARTVRFAELHWLRAAFRQRRGCIQKCGVMAAWPIRHRSYCKPPRWPSLCSAARSTSFTECQTLSTTWLNKWWLYWKRSTSVYPTVTVRCVMWWGDSFVSVSMSMQAH